MLTQSPPDSHSADRHIAAIDLGSNSFHMVIAKTSHGELQILDKLGEKVQLASGINTHGHLTDDAMQRAYDCLKRFQQRIRAFNAKDVQIVGTNALRVAKNRRDFIAKAEGVIGFPIEVISGREEARLIYLGVAHTMADDEGKRLVIDIGGGSTEFIIGERFETNLLESLHMGCVSYRERYLSAKNIESKDFDHAVLQASRELLNIKQLYKQLGWSGAVGSSGTIKAIATALTFCEISDGLITLSALEELKARMFAVGKVNNLHQLGVKEERSTVFASGLAILYASFKVLGIKQLSYTSGALREGLLYDILGRIEHEDVRNRTIQSLQSRYHVDARQASIVQQTVVHAFEQVADDWNIRSDLAHNLLLWASQIYEIGNTISHTQHHKHGAYLVEHSDLPGFTNRAKLLLATIVRLHRRRLASEILDLFDESDRALVFKLCLIFRIAIVLTSARVSEETTFRLNSCGSISEGDFSIYLEMGDGWLSKHPLTNANLLTERDYLAKLSIGLELK